ncbi:unnamed protein product, partial [Musa acuminata var. zebrina]
MRAKQAVRHVAELGALPTLRIALAALLVTAISIGSEPSDPLGLGPHPLRRATPSPAPAAAPPCTTSAPSPRRTPTPTASPPSLEAT